jgi:signal transduction histidine kinase
VGVSAEPEALRIEVVDDGSGGATIAPGSGLQGLRDRVEAIGGRLELHSPHGGGTRLRARLPLTPGDRLRPPAA